MDYEHLRIVPNLEDIRGLGDFRDDKNFLLGYLEEKDNGLEYRYDAEQLRIEPWGKNSLRVRATKCPVMPEEDWALTEIPEKAEAIIKINDYNATITNGNITAEINNIGKIIFYNKAGEIILEEFVRNREDMFAKTTSSLNIEAREFAPITGGDYTLTARFESDPNEKIYGMGQYQQNFLNLKGAQLELAHRNSQASVPFYVSSLMYGFLWNNPSIGKVEFTKNMTSWLARSTDKLDYWITVGDTPEQIEQAYANVTGKVPMMPEFGLGFWQCKLRYQTQQEVLDVAREYYRRGIPVDVIVVDYFHWPYQGDWRFDPVYWPDPEAMIQELKDMNMELMVSVWPSVDIHSENYQEMLAKGLLTRTERGVRITHLYQGNTVYYDATNQEARDYVWEKCKKNYYDMGVRTFWLDVAEPQFRVYDFDNYRYSLGPNVRVGNIYPREYAKTFYEGMEAEGQENIVNLLRCAWAGSQKYGALVWSGDIHSSYESFQNQICAGMSMAMAGIPWWTTDIGGFFGGDIRSEEFKELFVRWFEYGTFCPVMRLHGYRIPYQPQFGETGGATCHSGAPNEIWSYGEEVYEICKDYIFLRERMRPYTRQLMRDAHELGNPIMRPLFYDFPEDKRCWEEEMEFMYGPDVLVAPIYQKDARRRDVYLPSGTAWKNYWTGEWNEGGISVTVEAPLHQIPLFLKAGKEVF